MVFAPVSIRVPATIANLGPGFDCLGLAVGLWLSATAEPCPHPEFIYQGNGTVNPKNNLMHAGWNATFKALGLEPATARITCQNPIPLARGLGSSSAALVGGAALADHVLGNKLGREGVLKICAALEGHPDNVAPAVLGGFTASAMQGDIPLSVSLPVPSTWRAVFAIPDYELKTSEARAALPSHYSKAETIFNASRTALWVAALSAKRFELLREACRDQMHQPQRAKFVPNLLETIEAALESGALAAFLSGAGPSIAALCEEHLVSGVKVPLQKFASRILELPIATGYELQSEVVHGRQSA
jgi:homoserine kinase